MMDPSNLSCAEEWFLLKYYPPIFLRIRFGEDVEIPHDVIWDYLKWYTSDKTSDDYKPGGKYYYDSTESL